MIIKRIISKFGSILTRHQKIRIIQLTLLMLFGGILETLSVSLILPFVEMMMSPDEAMQKVIIKQICDFLQITLPTTMLIFIAVLLGVLYVIKNIFLIFEYSIQYRFVYGNMFTLQKRLLESVINRPYETFLNINSGDMIRIIGTDVHETFFTLTTLLSVFTEAIVSLMLVITIFVVSPGITLCIASVLIVMMLLIVSIFKEILRKAGEDEQKSVAGMNKWLLQAIQGIKEVKVTRKEDFFKDNFDQCGKTYVRSLRRRQSLIIAPRFMIEGICMGAMFIIIAVMIYFGTDIDKMIPLVAAVAMASIRLLPSVNRISSSINTITYYEPMVDKVIETVHWLDDNEDYKKGKNSDFEQKGVVVPRLETSIHFDSISYHYPNTTEYVMDHASFSVKKGEFIGIVGTSGAGKTTSVDILLGLLIPQSGQVKVDGVDISKDLNSWLMQLSYIPQMIFMLDDTIRSNVAFGVRRNEIDENMVWDALKEAALDDFVRSLPDGLDTQIGERGMRLSGGQRQRIGIARALYQNPEVLIFDEATSALDNETETAIMESINKLQGKKTIIIIAHRLTTIQACNHIFRVEGGKVVKER